MYMFLHEKVTWGTEPKPSENCEEVTVMVSESLPYGGEQDGTMLLCSPSAAMATDVAMDTMRKLDEHDKKVEAEVAETKAR